MRTALLEASRLLGAEPLFLPVTIVMSSATENVQHSVAGAFFGFTIGAVLFGITILQTYLYFTTYPNDSKWQKATISTVCLLDALHLAFSIDMMYAFVVERFGDVRSGSQALWSLKALGTTQVFFIVFVQCLYLYQIWKLSQNLLLKRRTTRALQVFVVVVALSAFAVGVVFLVELQRITVILGFDENFQYAIYLGFGATALIDIAIACAMCFLLYKSNIGTRADDVLASLIDYFIGSGLTTSFFAIMCIVLYVAKPDSLLYLGIEFSTPRIYANSVLAMYNSRGRLRERLNATIDLGLGSSRLCFQEPQHINLALVPTASISEDTESMYPSPDKTYGEHSCECASLRGRKDRDGWNTRGFTV